jgi:hypothetical protein
MSENKQHLQRLLPCDDPTGEVGAAHPTRDRLEIFQRVAETRARRAIGVMATVDIRPPWCREISLFRPAGDLGRRPLHGRGNDRSGDGDDLAKGET